MKRLLFVFTLIFITGLSIDASAQYDYNWAVGFRVGEPLGFNVRKYFQNGDKAFDVNVGTYGFLYNRQRRYNAGEYKTAGLMIQGIYLWQNEVLGRDWAHVYYGFGGQVNSRSHYADILIGQKVDHIRKIALGPTGTAGIELKLPNQPIAFFVDAGLYIEALPSPFFWNGQVSGGIRLNIIK
ncbi:hypothetical protein [Emticicia sp. SJ17W-69]|uniref:hypothetical protein n=1 Tax=Emticicia sp. SJ17W-69 TaxID=3421657 RepID=UPI003EB8E680